MEKEEVIKRLKDLVKYLGYGYITSYNVLMLDLNKVDDKMINDLYTLFTEVILSKKRGTDYDYDYSQFINKRFDYPQLNLQ